MTINKRSVANVVFAVTDFMTGSTFSMCIEPMPEVEFTRIHMSGSEFEHMYERMTEMMQQLNESRKTYSYTNLNLQEIKEVLNG